MLEQPLSTASVWTRYHWLSSLCSSFWLLWRLKATVESRLKRPSPRLWTQRRKLFAHVMRLHSLFLTWRLEILFPVASLLGWVLSLSKAQRWNSLTWRPSHSRINIVCSQILAPPILSIIWTRFDFLVLVITPATLRRALHGSPFLFKRRGPHTEPALPTRADHHAVRWDVASREMTIIRGHFTLSIQVDVIRNVYLKDYSGC